MAARKSPAKKAVKSKPAFAPALDMPSRAECAVAFTAALLANPALVIRGGDDVSQEMRVRIYAQAGIKTADAFLREYASPTPEPLLKLTVDEGIEGDD